MPAIFITILAWIIGVAAALYLGTSFGDSDYLKAILAFFICGGIAYVCWLQRYTLIAILAILFYNFQFYTFGFNINPDEIASIIALALLVIHIWQPQAIASTPPLNSKPFKFLRTCAIAWCIFTVLHAAIHILQIHFSHEPGIRNVIKSYFNYIIPYILLVYFLFQPHPLRISKNILTWIIVLCFLGIIANAAMRFHQQFYGILIQYNEDTVPEPFYIPYLNLVENVYALRTIGPFSALLGIIVVTSKAWRKNITLMRVLGLLMICLGIFGSMISGGRASVFLCFVFIFLALFLRKSYSLLASIAIFLLVLIGIANSFSSNINNNLPYFITRSLQFLILNKKAEAMNDIEGSSKWRNELHAMAFDEWIKTPKNLIFGRGFQGMQEGEDWYTAFTESDRGLYMQQLSLRRVATHSMITDLLLSVGLIGTIIYYSFLVSIVVFCWKTFKEKFIHETPRDISLILIVSSFSYIGVATIAAGIMNPIYLWILIALCASLQANDYDPNLPLLQKDPLPLYMKLKKHTFSIQNPNK